MSLDAQPMSAQEAKLRLLEWSELADEALLREIHQVVASVESKVKKVTPWVAGAALLLGVLRGGRRRDKAPSAGGPLRAGIGVVRTAIRTAIFVLPLIKPFLSRQGGNSHTK